MHAGSKSELPDAAVYVIEAVERTPILHVLGLVSRQRHHSNISDHVLVVHVVIHKLGFVSGVKGVEQFCAFPNGISPQQEVFCISFPVDIANAKVVVLWHFERSAAFNHIFGCCARLCFDLLDSIVHVVNNLVVNRHI